MEKLMGSDGRWWNIEDAQQESYAQATNASSIYFFGINRLFAMCYL